MSDILPYVYVGIVLFAGSTLQATVGFGYGLFAVPVLLLLGWQPYEAMAIVGACVIVHGWFCIWRSRHELLWGELWWLIAIGCAMQPVGNLLLSKLVGKAILGQVFGCLLLGGLALRAWWQPEPRERLHPLWGVLTMTLFGLLSGVAGMGGPPVVLWLLAHKWSNERIRLVMWTIFSTSNVTNLIWLAYRFQPAVVLSAAGVGLMFLPVVMLGAWPADWLNNRMSHTALRRIAMSFLVLIGLYAILQPIILPELGHRPSPVRPPVRENQAIP
ncbi:MAG: hypothetical protein PCFJNLEI_02107 [Verrucomicrobiae bacterium]|nr:hypothetical protein [Verrucomicrobiae bacterium]